MLSYALGQFLTTHDYLHYIHKLTKVIQRRINKNYSIYIYILSDWHQRERGRGGVGGGGGEGELQFGIWIWITKNFKLQKRSSGMKNFQLQGRLSTPPNATTMAAH
jgi:hypothetical protein